MKARLDAIVKLEQAEYLERLLPANTGVLVEMEEYAEAHRVPIADREVARFLEITARSTGARNRHGHRLLGHTPRARCGRGRRGRHHRAERGDDRAQRRVRRPRGFA